jgi:hypothetical protein
MGEWTSGAVCQIVPVLLTIALFAWARSVARRHSGAGWRVATLLPFIALVFHFVGVFVTVWLLIDAFGAVAHANPARRSALLSDGISRAMWGTAIGSGAALALYVASAITSLVGMRKS